MPARAAAWGRLIRPGGSWFVPWGPDSSCGAVIRPVGSHSSCGDTDRPAGASIVIRGPDFSCDDLIRPTAPCFVHWVPDLFLGT